MADIFVDPAATGANNGTSYADAYTNAQSAFDTVTSSDRIRMRGTQTLTVAIDVDITNGALGGLIEVVGENASGVEDGTKFVLDGNSTAFNCLTINKNRYVFRNIQCKNATSNGVSFTSGASYNLWINFLSNNHGGSGFGINGNGDFNIFFRCTSKLNASNGWLNMDQSHLLLCLIEDNGSNGVSGPSQLAALLGCISQGNTGDGVKPNFGTPIVIWQSIIDGNGGHGINDSASFITAYLANRITNNTLDGLKIAASSNALEDWNFAEGNGGIDLNLLGDVISLGNSLTAGTQGYTDRPGGNFDLTFAATGRRQAVQIGANP